MVDNPEISRSKRRRLRSIAAESLSQHMLPPVSRDGHAAPGMRSIRKFCDESVIWSVEGNHYFVRAMMNYGTWRLLLACLATTAGCSSVSDEQEMMGIDDRSDLEGENEDTVADCTEGEADDADDASSGTWHLPEPADADRPHGSPSEHWAVEHDDPGFQAETDRGQDRTGGDDTPGGCVDGLCSPLDPNIVFKAALGPGGLANPRGKVTGGGDSNHKPRYPTPSSPP